VLGVVWFPVLFACCAFALAWSLVYGIENDYDSATHMVLTAAALGLLLSPSALAHVNTE
jgi:hypothetical protein